MRECMSGSRVEISVLLIQEEDSRWSAQCLEYDICAQARSFADLPNEFERVVVSHIAASIEMGLQPFEGVPPAPSKYWEMFKRARIVVSEQPDDMPSAAVISQMKVAAGSGITF